MASSPCLDAVHHQFQIDPARDFPDEAAEVLCALRRRLADAPPENLADAARMAAELAQMMSEGEAVDGTDLKLARALAHGLKEICYQSSSGRY